MPHYPREGGLEQVESVGGEGWEPGGKNGGGGGGGNRSDRCTERGSADRWEQDLQMWRHMETAERDSKQPRETYTRGWTEEGQRDRCVDSS